MRPSRAAGLVGVAVTAIAVLHNAFGVPGAAADECPDIEVVFARGTGAPPGPGWLGDAFVNALRSKVGNRSVGLYAVNYPAGFNFSASASQGAADARARVLDMTARCPNTRLILGGNSQGAGVIDLITMPPTPVAGLTPDPIPAELADHVAAVAVFGNPLRDMTGGRSLADMSPTFGGRTIDLCAPGDPFCSGGLDFPAHLSYVQNGMAEQAAAFAAERVRA